MELIIWTHAAPIIGCWQTGDMGGREKAKPPEIRTAAGKVCQSKVLRRNRKKILTIVMITGFPALYFKGKEYWSCSSTVKVILLPCFLYSLQKSRQKSLLPYPQASYMLGR